MTGIDYIIDAELTGPLAGNLIVAFEEAYRESIAKWAVDRLDLASGGLGADWDQLDDPLFRTGLAMADDNLNAGVAHQLDDRIDHLRTTIKEVVGNRQTREATRSRIAALVPNWLTRADIKTLFGVSPFTLDWSFIADEIGRRLHRTCHSWLPIPAREEWRLINQLVLAEYFRQCRHPRASQVRNELGEAGTGLMSIRGTLQNTITNVSASGIQGDEVPISSFSGGINMFQSHLSDSLDTVSRESRETASGNGVMRRIVGGHHRREQPHAVRAGRFAMTSVESARDLAYARYERTILAYMAIASIEQMLRALATNREGSAFHLKAGNIPKGVPGWVEHLGLPPGLVDRILVLFDSARGNVRNRIMHGVFVFTSTKRLQDNLSVLGMAPPLPSGSSPDRYTPANIAHLALECLRDLDAQFVGVPFTDADFEWAAAWRLTADEITFCSSLASELVLNADQSNLIEADNRRKELSEYFRAVMPGLGQFFRLGYIGVIQSHSTNTLPLLHGLGIVFEPIYRLTCHLLGLEVVQKPEKLTDILHFQYWMLDKDGLCRESHLDRLVQHRDGSTREEAKLVLQMAVKARNAMAHGAVIRFDQPTSDGIKRLFAEAIQLLVEAGRHHMNREASWYNWKNVHKSQDGHHFGDWLTGEKEVGSKINELGHTPNV